jgi:hypothetical protein
VSRADGLVAGKRGKKAAALPAGLKTFDKYVSSPWPALPASIAVPNVPLPICGNDEYGDCVIAAAAHAIAIWNALLGKTDPVPDEAACVAQYKALTGCKEPGDENDTGLVISEFLEKWRTDGMFGTSKIAYYGPVSQTDHGMIRQGIANYGIVFNGYRLPQCAETDFNADLPWIYDPSSPIIGGHCTLHAGYSGIWVYDPTWGGVAQVGPQFTAHQSDETYVIVPQEFVEAGRGPELDLAQLQADIDSLDG